MQTIFRHRLQNAVSTIRRVVVGSFTAVGFMTVGAALHAAAHTNPAQPPSRIIEVVTVTSTAQAMRAGPGVEVPGPAPLAAAPLAPIVVGLPLAQAAAIAEEAGAPKLAARWFREATEANSEDVEALVGLGRARFDLWDDAGAAAPLQRALALQPDHADAHLMLGYLAQLKGQRRDAKRHFDAFLRSSPGDARTAEVKALLRRL